MPRDTGRVSQNCNAAYMYVCPLFENGDTSLASIPSQTSILCNVLEHLTTTTGADLGFLERGFIMVWEFASPNLFYFLLKYPMKVK